VDVLFFPRTVFNERAFDDADRDFALDFLALDFLVLEPDRVRLSEKSQAYLILIEFNSRLKTGFKNWCLYYKNK
jgi:hypothetical protein